MEKENKPKMKNLREDRWFVKEDRQFSFCHL